MKASAGAVEHLLLSPVDDLAATLADLHSRGLRIVGADGEAQLTAREADLRGPVAIVVGSEGKGLGPAVRKRCDLLVRIPMHGRIDSLNAAVAGSILLYEAASQRGIAERPGAPEDGGAADARVDGDDHESPAAEPDVAPADAEPDVEEPSAAEPSADDAPEPVPAKTRARRVTMVSSVPAARTRTPAAKASKGTSTKATPDAGEAPAATSAEPTAKTAKATAKAAKATAKAAARDAAPAKDAASPKGKASPKAPSAAKDKAGQKGKSGTKKSKSSSPTTSPDVDELLPGGPPVE